MKSIIKIFSIYFIPGIDEDGIYNFDYELLPYEFIRLLFYCILVKYCPNENYIKSKRNKIYNENIIIEQEMKKEEEERVNTGNKTENATSPSTNKPPTESKKSEISEKLSKKNTAVDIPDPSKEKQLSNLSTIEPSEKTETISANSNTTTRNGKKLSTSVSQPPEEKVEENKKGTAPKSSNNNDNLDNSNDTQKKADTTTITTTTTTIKFNINPQKFKYFEFHGDEEPSFIINTFMNKLLISRKDDDNNSYVK
ncbi:hypothetical protein PIROE2DRAFT_17833, partial [Piromyces sp. E2]